MQVYDEAFSKDYIGRVALDIGLLEKEKTHQKELKLQEGNGEILMLLTVSGTHGVDSISDLINHTPSPEQDLQLKSRYVRTNIKKIVLKKLKHFVFHIFFSLSQIA
jgi:hypothetical protein